MIDFYFAPTPNGWKVGIMLEECGLDYRTILMDLPRGEQFDAQFLRISPFAKIPAIVDHDGASGPVSVFESGAILLYLANKKGRYSIPSHTPGKDVHEWLFWQAAHLGPAAGQLSYFRNYAPERIEHAIERHLGEYRRCIRMVEKRLGDRSFLLGEYSIVDMMIFPWIFIARNLGVNLAEFPQVARWRAEIKARPAVIRAIDLHKNAQFSDTANAANSPLLFNPTARDMLS